jgi:hypothetical protein
MRNGYKIGVGEPARKRSLKRSRRTKEDIIQAVLKLELECGLYSSGSGKGLARGLVNTILITKLTFQFFHLRISLTSCLFFC